MLNLMSIGKKQQGDRAAGRSGAGIKQSPGELRVQKDITELNLPSTMTIVFPEGKDRLLRFDITIQPDEGYYTGGSFLFSFNVPTSYPHDAPKVKCNTKVYHPNIDFEGNICLNILREDWKPVLSINSIVYGLQFLFLDPNPDDPLNHEAAQVLKDNPKQFESNVRKSMLGGYVGGQSFPRSLR